MSETCPIVQIEVKTAPGGFVEINESDFDEKIHTLYKPQKAEEAVNAETENGKTFEVINEKGEKTVVSEADFDAETMTLLEAEEVPMSKVISKTKPKK